MMPSVRVTFPTPMVDLDKVKRGGQQNPIVFDPFTPSSWIWVSQTEGAITFPNSVAKKKKKKKKKKNWLPHNVTYRAKLRPGLKDLAGDPVDAQNWGAELAYDKFTLRTLRFL